MSLLALLATGAGAPITPDLDPVRAAIVAQLDDLAAQTQQLKVIYQQKLAALSELKQSILQQAFSGALSMS